MSADEKVSYSDLFNFGDATEPEKALKIIDALGKTYAQMADVLKANSREAASSMAQVKESVKHLQDQLKKSNDLKFIVQANADGEKYLQTVAKLEQQQKTYQAQISKLEKEVSRLQKSKASIAKLNEHEASSLTDLKKQLAEAEAKYKALGDAQSETVKAEALKAVEELSAQYNSQNAILQDVKKARDLEAGSLESLTQQLKEAEREYAKLGDSAGETVKKESLENISRLNQEIGRHKDALKEAKAARDVEAGSLDELKARLKEAEANYRALGDGVEDAVREEALNKIKQLGQAVADGDKAIRDAKKGMDVAVGSYNALAQEVNELNRDLKNLPDAWGKNRAEAERLQKVIYDKTEALKKFDQAVNTNWRSVGKYSDALKGVSFNEMGEELKELKQRLNDLPDAFGQNREEAIKLQRAIRDKTKTIDDFNKRLEANASAMGRYARAMQDVGRQIKDAIGIGSAIAIFATLSQGFKSAANANREFEKSLSTLSSITGAVGQDLEYYKEQAEEIGMTTTLSASQAVEAFKLMGSASPELLKNKEALAATTREAVILAEAAGIDLPEATQALASTMAQFKLPASEASRIINALAAGSQVGAAEIPELTAAVDKAGNTLRGFSVDVEEGVAAVEVLSMANIKGAEAGTQLRNVLLQMQTIDTLPKNAQEKLAQYGVSLEKVKDETIPLSERMEELSKITEDAAAMKAVFGKENINAAKAMLENVDLLKEYTAGVTGTNTALTQASTNVNNLDGDVKSFTSVLESLVLEGGALNNVMRAVVQGFTQFLLAVKATPEFIRENKELIGALAFAMLTLNAHNISAAASALGHAAAEKGRAIATNAATVATRILNTVMKANPIGLVITAVTLLTTAFIGLTGRSEKLTAGMEGLGAVAKEVFKIVTETVGAFVNAWNKIKSGDIAGGMADMGKAIIKANPVVIAATQGERLAGAFTGAYNESIKQSQEEAAAEQLQRDRSLADKRHELKKAEIQKEVALLQKKRQLTEKGSDEEKEILEEIAAKREEITQIDERHQQVLMQRKREDLQKEITLIEEKLKAVKKGTEEELDLRIELNKKIEELNQQGAKTQVAGWSADEETPDDPDGDDEAAKERMKRVREAAREVQKIRLEAEKETNEAIAKDNQKSLFERLEARRQVAEAEVELAKITRDKALDQEGLIDEERAVIHERHKFRIQEIETEMKKSLDSITGKFAEVKEAGKDIWPKPPKVDAIKSAENAYLQSILKLEEAFGSGDIDRKDLIAGRLQAEQSFIEQKLALMKQAGASEEEILKAEISMRQRANAEKLANEQQFWANVQQVAANSMAAATELFNAVSAGKIQRYEEELSALKKGEEEQLAAVSENADAKKAVEERYAKKREEINDRMARERRKQAVFEKAMAATQIAINTAQAIARTLAEVPKVDFGISTAVLVASYAALGAAQLAAVMAKPIPGYYTGVEYAKEGEAYVGERGREIRIEPTGEATITPSTRTKTYLKEGTQIINHEETEKLLKNSSKNNLPAGTRVDDLVAPILNQNKETSREESYSDYVGNILRKEYVFEEFSKEKVKPETKAYDRRSGIDSIETEGRYVVDQLGNLSIEMPETGESGKEPQPADSITLMPLTSAEEKEQKEQSIPEYFKGTGSILSDVERAATVKSHEQTEGKPAVYAPDAIDLQNHSTQSHASHIQYAMPYAAALQVLQLPAVHSSSERISSKSILNAREVQDVLRTESSRRESISYLNSLSSSTEKATIAAVKSGSRQLDNEAKSFDERILGSLEDLKNTLEHTIRNKREVHLNVDKNGMRIMAKEGLNWIEYVNNRYQD